MSPDVTKTLELYVDQLREIKYRTNVISEMALGSRYTTPYPATNIELIYLQFRKVLELIALASLVANKEQYSSIRSKFETDWHAERILETLEKANPSFYPKPGKQVLDEKTGKVISVEPITSGFLEKSEFVELYGLCGQLMHSRNPFSTPIDFDGYKSRAGEWFLKITTLLNHHQIQLTDTDYMIWALMQAKDDGQPRAYLFARASQR